MEGAFHAVGYLWGFSHCTGAPWACAAWPPGLSCKVELAENTGVDCLLHEMGGDAPDSVAEGAEGIGDNQGA